jgi:hypothetical protein
MLRVSRCEDWGPPGAKGIGSARCIRTRRHGSRPQSGNDGCSAPQARSEDQGRARIGVQTRSGADQARQRIAQKALSLIAACVERDINRRDRLFPHQRDPSPDHGCFAVSQRCLPPASVSTPAPQRTARSVAAGRPDRKEAAEHPNVRSNVQTDTAKKVSFAPAATQVAG